MELKREDFLAQYPPLYFLNKADVANIWDKEEIHLYVHIPYCAKKCGFCYYKSFPIGNAPIPDEYFEALKTEIEIYANMPEVQSKCLRSIYLGGGTPTLLSEKQIETLMMLIKSKFNFAVDYEFCSEARPGQETSLEKLRLLKALGMKRLSVGCQSTDDFVLESNGRNHNSKDFMDVFERARQTGIYCINVDIMSGMVNQSLESWLETVKTISDLKPENIAIYKLEIYLNNALYARYRKGNVRLISDAAEVEYARQGYGMLLDSGYRMADNFSFMLAPEYDHVHRREVWKGADMLGVGLSSHSCFNDYIYQNEPKLDDYMERLKRNELPVQRAHKITAREELIQRMVFGIKNLFFERAKFLEEFGVDVMDVFPEQLTSLEKQGFISIYPDHIRTSFEGAIFADDIVREFYMPEHRKTMLAHVKRPEN